MKKCTNWEKEIEKLASKVSKKWPKKLTSVEAIRRERR